MAAQARDVRRSGKAARHEWFLSAILRAFSRLSLPTSHRIGRLLGFLLLKIPNKQRRNAMINIQLCFPQLTTEEALRFHRRSLLEYGKTHLEVAYLWLRPVDTVLASVRGVSGGELLQREDGRGVIVLSPHLGAWELAGLYLSTLGPTTILYRPQAVLDSLIGRARGRGGASVVPPDRHGIRCLIGALRRGEYVGILPDQEPKAHRGAVFAPFFGVPAFTMSLVSRLSRNTGARVVFLFAQRLPRGEGFRIHCLPSPAGIESEDDVEAGTALNRGVEQCVSTCPDQYVWAYKRFRNRPDGLPHPYRGPV